MDKRAEQLDMEYRDKARATDRNFGGVERGRIGPVENKLLSFPQVQGLVFGSYGEASEPVHKLVEILATSSVQVSGPQRGKRVLVRGEE